MRSLRTLKLKKYNPNHWFEGSEINEILDFLESHTTMNSGDISPQCWPLQYSDYLEVKPDYLVSLSNKLKNKEIEWPSYYKSAKEEQFHIFVNETVSDSKNTYDYVMIEIFN